MSRKILTMYDTRKAHTRDIWNVLNLDLLRIILNNKFQGITHRDEQTVKNIIEMKILDYARRIMTKAYSSSNSRGYVDVFAINNLIETIDLESTILAALMDEHSDANFLYNYLSANAYVIHSVNGRHTGTDHWLKYPTLMDRISRLPSGTQNRFSIFVDKQRSDRSTMGVKYNIRVQMMTPAGTIRKLNLRAKSENEMLIIIDTLKAFNRGLGAGGFIKALFADNFFSRASTLANENLVVRSESFTLTREVDGVIHKYKVATLDQLKIYPELARGVLVDGNTRLKVGDDYYPIVRAEAVSVLDLGAIFSNPNDALGYLLEILGFEESHTHDTSATDGVVYHTAYGLIKDVQCLLNLEAGFVPIYTARTREYNYYKSAAQLSNGDIKKINNIGVIAPLLTDRQYSMLMDALGFATGFSLTDIIAPEDIPQFEEILRDLSLHFERYGFYIDERADLVKIQEAFGLIVNEDFTVAGTTPNYAGDVSDYAGIRTEMQQWWENLRKSRQSTSIMDKIYQYYLKFVDPEIDSVFFNSQYAREFRSKYYWFH
ncbi:MAG: hypothetical protein ACTSVK_02160 [Promethearchaeota archaeon]